ncbi:MAG: MerR family transcriptional regulator [Saprospiraceae bacterium]
MQNLPSDKVYFTIGEVAQILDVNTSLIRYWEKEFKMIKPAKTRKGDRRYIKHDVALLQKIHHLVKEKGFTLDGAKKELVNQSESSKEVLLLTSLEKIKLELIKLKDKL